MLRPNKYGKINLSEIESDCVHVPGLRLEPLCRRLCIEYLSAMSGWGGGRRYPKPILEGVVVYRRDEAKLKEGIAQREKRMKNRERKKRLAKCQYLRRFPPADRKWIRSNKTVFLPSGSAWERKPQHSEEISFLRELTPADRHRWLVFADWLDEHDAGSDAATIRTEHAEFLARNVAGEARLAGVDLPQGWREYLIQHGFLSQTAVELAKALKDPRKASPLWFRSAVVAVDAHRKEGEPITYGRVCQWIRTERYKGGLPAFTVVTPPAQDSRDPVSRS